MKPFRIAFVQPIVDPVREAWFRAMARDSDASFRVFALRRTLDHRPGWESRQDAGFDVEFVRTAAIRRSPFSRSVRRNIGIRLVPLDLVWRLWRYKPAVIVVTNATELVQALAVRLLCGARIVVSAEDTKLSFSRTGRLTRRVKAFLLRRVDLLCAHSSAARALLADLGIPATRIARTPWAVDNDQFARRAAEADANEVRRKLELHGVVFVTVASLTSGKGIDRLLAAWALIPRDVRAKASLLLVGDGPERRRLTERVRDQGLDEVRFAGHLTHGEVAECLGASDVFVLPTLEDVWGLVVNEAMAAGLPVLCSNYAGCADDLVRQDVNGYVFDPLDAASFGSLMSRLIERPERLAEMGMRSTEIIGGFTIAHSVACLLDALRVAAASARDARTPKQSIADS